MKSINEQIEQLVSPGELTEDQAFDLLTEDIFDHVPPGQVENSGAVLQFLRSKLGAVVLPALGILKTGGVKDAGLRSSADNIG